MRQLAIGFDDAWEDGPENGSLAVGLFGGSKSLLESRNGLGIHGRRSDRVDDFMGKLPETGMFRLVQEALFHVHTISLEV